MLLGWFACWLHAQISAHAQMKNQCPVVQVDEQEFSPPAQTDYLTLLQPFPEINPRRMVSTSGSSGISVSF